MKELIATLAAAAMKMPSLAKTSRNQYGGFSYAPIDEYYAVVSPALHELGVIWTVSERAPPDLIQQGFIFHFRCTFWKDEARLDVDMSVPMPWQGAQTAGAAQSYAAKCFLRGTLALVTGEPDADATDSKSFEPGAVPAPRQKSLDVVNMAGSGHPTGGVPSTSAGPPAAVPSAAGVRDSSQEVSMGEMQPILQDWYEGNLPVLINPERDPSFPWALARDIMVQGVAHVTGVDKITGWWRANIAVMDQMKEFDTESHKAVVKAFETRRSELTKVKK